MMLIVRLFPKMDLSKVWDYVESDLITNAESDGVTPLYASQTEGMMSVGVILNLIIQSKYTGIPLRPLTLVTSPN